VKSKKDWTKNSKNKTKFFYGSVTRSCIISIAGFKEVDMLSRLKMLILEQYGSQREFCQAIGKSDDWLSRVIRGWKNPTLEQKELIAGKLKVGLDNIDELFYCVKRPPSDFDRDVG